MIILEMISTNNFIESAEKIELKEVLREEHAEQLLPSYTKKK